MVRMRSLGRKLAAARADLMAAIISAARTQSAIPAPSPTLIQ
jgi:hypothetical protein